jgi:hypothetical protein
LFPSSVSPSPIDIHFSGLAAVMCWEAYRTCTLDWCYYYRTVYSPLRGIKWMDEGNESLCCYLEFPFPPSATNYTESIMLLHHPAEFLGVW